MKAVVKRVIRYERGAALILTIILLLIGGLIASSLLAHMGTGILTGEVYGKRTAELYAADAGVEDAVRKIQTNNLTFDTSNCSEPWHLSVNDKGVEVVVYRTDWDPTPCGENFTYRILSTAATDDGGGAAAIDSSTTIDAYLAVSYTYMDFSPLLDYAIVSNNTVTLQGKTTVNGDIWLPESEDLNDGPNVTVNGTVKDSDNVTITWPTADQLREYYLQDVVGAADCGPSIDIKSTKAIGPCYRDGNLVVDNTGGSATLVLEGTVYVAGDLTFEQPGGHEYTIDLNGQTIFAEGSITFPSNHVNISGSGCIIAVGNIDFQPGIASGGNDFVLVMSITGAVAFHPNGNFTGCVAGNEHVQVQPNGNFDWISPKGKGLNFPMGPGDGGKLPPLTGLRILSWEIK